MKKMLILLFLIAVEANASCDNLTAPSSVSEKTYVLVSSDEYPAKLSFGKPDVGLPSDFNNYFGQVDYVNAHSGHPGGKFFYLGMCDDVVGVIFRQELGPPKADTIILRLTSPDNSYRTLVDEEQGYTFELVE